MDYAQYLELLQHRLLDDRPSSDSETVLGKAASQPSLPLTTTQQTDYDVLRAALSTKIETGRGVIIIATDPLYVLYLLSAMPASLNTTALPYPLAAYQAMLTLYRTELQQPQLNLEYFSYSARLYYMSLHHRRVFQDLADTRSGTLLVTLNEAPDIEAVNIVTQVPCLLQHDTRELAWQAVDLLSLQRDYQILDLSTAHHTSVLPFVYLSPERFVMHANTIELIEFVSPDTYDYCRPETWVSHDGKDAIMFVFPYSCTVNSPLSESYIHRELLRMTVNLTIGEYVVMCLTDLFLAQDRSFRVTVDQAWLRRENIPLFEGRGSAPSLELTLLRSLASNLVVTWSEANQTPKQQVVMIKEDRTRWNSVRAMAKQYQTVLSQL